MFYSKQLPRYAMIQSNKSEVAIQLMAGCVRELVAASNASVHSIATGESVINYKPGSSPYVFRDGPAGPPPPCSPAQMKGNGLLFYFRWLKGVWA